MRKTKFINDEYYHIYNRGIDKRDIFTDGGDRQKFLRNLVDFNNKSFYEERIKIIEEQKELSSFLKDLERVVDVVTYSLLPNHFHLILKQLSDKGVSDFMHKIGTSFTNFFNKKYNRSGSLFQGSYKSIHIQNDEYLLWLSGYINGNIEIHKIGKAESYKWSSFKSFLGKEQDAILGDVSVILSQFKDFQGYKLFAERVIVESMVRKEMEEYLLEKIN